MEASQIVIDNFLPQKTSMLSILDQSPSGILILSNGCKIEYCNKSTSEMFGYQDTELFKQDSFQNLFPVSLITKLEESYKEINDGSGQTEFEQVCITKDQREFPVRFKVVPIDSDTPENDGVLCYMENLSKTSSQTVPHVYNQKYVKLIEDANDGIVVLQDNVIKHFNSAIAKISGYDSRDALGANFLDFVSPAYKELVVQNHVKRMQGMDAPSVYEIELTSISGKSLPMEIATQMIEFYGRSAVMVVFRDISERKEAEKKLITAKLEAESAEERLETVLYNILSGVVLVDVENHKIADVNPIAEEMFGLPKEKIIGNICHSYICPAQVGKCPVTDLGKVVDRSEKVLINKDGNEIPILKSAVPVIISGKEYLVESFIDLTRIKEAEQDLIESKLAAESANRAKSDFIATMSHELRTPLNSIIGFSDLMIGGGVGELAEMQKKFLGNISTSGKHLLSLINNILDLSKIEAGKMELNCETIDAYGTIYEVKQLVSPLADKKNLKMEFTMDERLENIYADRVRFKQILFNLISNAIKFTPASGTITISSVLVDNGVQFTVKDTGIGICEEDKAKLFQPFIQLDSATNRMYEGTGLGLSLVKRFIELHQGNIWFESELDKGTSFTFELPQLSESGGDPMSAEETNIAQGSSNPGLHDSKCTASSSHILYPPDSKGDESLILVAEDDDASRELLSFSLLSEGYSVALAKNGKEALELANELKPFAITLDIMMPGMDGWDVLKHLKEKPQTHGIPVIITSMLDEREMGVVWGAMEHFIKPIEKNLLLNTLDKIKENSSKSSPSVLVVDDEVNAVELITAMLKGDEFEVLSAYGGQEAIDIALKECPDVVLLDLMMPDVSGFDVIKVLKANPDTIDIPIIICTAKDLETTDVDELEGNVSHIIHKGMFSRDNLVDWIKVTQK